MARDRRAPASSAGPDVVIGVAARAPSRGPVLDLLAAAALWGGMYVVSAATFDTIPPLTLGVLRLVIGVAVAGAPR